MKRLRIPINLLTVLLTTVSFAAGQTGDWQIVKSIPNGTKIHITLKRGRVFGHCWLSDVTDEDLECVPSASRPFLVPLHRRQFIYRRSNIRSISLPRHTPLIGFTTGAIGGAALGAASPNPAFGRGGSAFFAGLILGAFGGWIGMIVDPIFHGKTVYRSTTDLPSH